MDYDYLSVSDGNGDAIVMHVTADRTAGATTLSVDSVVNVPNKFIATSGTLLSTGFIDPATKTDFKGHLDSGNIIIDSFEPGNTDLGNTEGQVVVIKPNTGWADRIATFIKNATGFGTPESLDINQLKLTATDIEDSNGDVLFSPSGWRAGLPTPSSVVYNGNRNYTLTFSAVDLTSKISQGMRLKLTRTVTAPTQCTSLNGSTQYYSKTSPAGMTFTDDFVAGGWVKLASYTGGIQTIIGRYDGTSGWLLYLNASGQVVLQGNNAGGANQSIVTSYQSVPLNKWVHITAQLDMSSFTATPTTSYVMIDGVNVPCSVSRGGTNPTALVQSGVLQIGAYNGATGLLNGKIAQAFVFGAKVTEATIQSYISQGLSGSETSLISAYSFNNSINDLNTTNANNLTANGSAVATNADSPFGQQADGTTAGTTEYGIVMKTAFSTNTTLTVQVPEGCAIPTSGGVSAVSYSVQKVPYGFPAQRGRWGIETLITGDIGSAVNGTAGNYKGDYFALNIPIGSWWAAYEAHFYSDTASSSSRDHFVTLSTSSTAETDVRWTTRSLIGQLSANQTVVSEHNRSGSLELTAQTTYYCTGKETNAVSNARFNGLCLLRAEPAYL